ncbi:MAG: T9SS type A sorting domain-containing protein [Bacteroidia bacterium]
MKRLITLGLLLSFFANAQAQNEYDWELVYEQDGHEFNYIDMYDYLTGIAVGKNGLVMMTENGGESWIDYSNPDLGDLIQIDVANKDTAFMTNGTDIFRTYNRGKDWTNLGNKGSKIIDINSTLHMDGWLTMACEGAELYMSHSLGDKWYKIENRSILSSNEKLIKFVGFMLRGDSLFGIYSAGIEYRFTLGSFDKWVNDNDPMIGSNTLMTKMNNVMDFHRLAYGGSQWFGYDNNYYFFLDNGTVSVRCSTATEQINSGSIYQIWTPDLTRKPGYAVGENGYIMSHKPAGKSYGEMVADTTSPTDKDLNWIDLGKGYNPEYDEFINDEMTFMVVGDGVILRKRFEWEPEPVSMRDNTPTPFDFKLFPNPSVGQANLRLSAVNENTLIQVYNANGVLVQQMEPTSLTMVLGNLSQGLYFVKVRNGQGEKVKKLLVY